MGLPLKTTRLPDISMAGGEEAEESIWRALAYSGVSGRSRLVGAGAQLILEGPNCVLSNEPFTPC